MPNSLEKWGSLAGGTAGASGQQLPRRAGAIDALRFFAWLDLVGGIIGAIVVWVMIFNSSTDTNPVTIGLGIAILLQGVFLCVLFLVIAGASEDIAAIRKQGAAPTS